MATEPDRPTGARPTDATTSSGHEHDPRRQERRTGDRDGRPDPRDVPVRGAGTRQEVTARQKDAYGGVKIGSAFFGWLAATGLAVILTALASAAGAAFGLTSDVSTDQALSQADTVGLAGGILLLVIVFVAYYCGGYVAGRMARFNGLVQGLAVWVWAVVVAVVLAVLAAVAGSQYDVLGRLDSFPRVPVSTSDLTTGGLVALGAVLVASLVGALLGGLAGMRFHRLVDRAGLGR